MSGIDIFYALSTPIRRDIIRLLSASEELTASAIANHFDVSASAISQHLKVLLESDVVEVRKAAQQRVYQLNESAIAELETWSKAIIDGLHSVNSHLKD